MKRSSNSATVALTGSFWLLVHHSLSIRNVDFLDLDEGTVSLLVVTSFLKLVVPFENLLVAIVELGTMTIFVKTELRTGILVAEIHTQTFLSSVQ